jgi:hypothetical protein
MPNAEMPAFGIRPSAFHSAGFPQRAERVARDLLELALHIADLSPARASGYTWIHWSARVSPADIDALCTLAPMPKAEGRRPNGPVTGLKSH